MNDVILPNPTAWHGAVTLTHLGAILAEGADTASFLHGQLTQDVQGQPPQIARLAGYCSPKGRLLASFLMLRPEADQLWLITDAGVLPSVLKRLSMFVLRAKTRLSTLAVPLTGIVGEPAAALAANAGLQEAWQVQTDGSGAWVRLPDVQGVCRLLRIGESADAVLKDLPALALSQWQWLEVMSGIARIEAATADQLVPQMVNYELIGAVNFQKGCYPGQEVVARSQYRGTTKRRTFLAHTAAYSAPGTEVFSERDPQQPAGLIVNAAPHDPQQQQGATSVLVELKLSESDAALHAGSIEGPTLTLAPLPYALPRADAS